MIITLLVSGNYLGPDEKNCLIFRSIIYENRRVHKLKKDLLCQKNHGIRYVTGRDNVHNKLQPHYPVYMYKYSILSKSSETVVSNMKC